MIWTQTLFVAVVAAVACERLLELVLSSRNRRLALEAGGVEVGQGHYRVMVLLHSSFLPACVLEVVLFDRPWVPWLATTSLVVVALAMVLRYWAIATLGPSWNTRVVVVPDRPAVTGGPYRVLRHPNYVAVVAEIAFLPLVHGAWGVALIYSIANALLLRHRIRVEEGALSTHTDWGRRVHGNKS